MSLKDRIKRIESRLPSMDMGKSIEAKLLSGTKPEELLDEELCWLIKPGSKPEDYTDELLLEIANGKR